MKLLFYLGHPAHYHLFKNAATQLIKNNHEVVFIIKKKDILEDLIKNAGFKFKNILPEGRKDSKWQIAYGLLKRDLRLLRYCLFNRPDLLIGTSTEITHVGKMLFIPSLVVNEDNYDTVKLFSSLGYPFASTILAPDCCPTGKPGSSWEAKTIHYKGYHELAYLHPNNFIPNPALVSEILNTREPFYIIRFAKLNAHHDEGKKGISDELALKIINKLALFGRVFITSEREFSSNLEKYRINIDPALIHYVMAEAQLYVGDSQTMAAEAAILGTPSIRFNDFIGMLGYLNELENKYELSFGISTKNENLLFEQIDNLLKINNLKELWKEKRKVLLEETIDVSAFMVWFIENYPASIDVMKKNPEFQLNFK